MNHISVWCFFDSGSNQQGCILANPFSSTKLGLAKRVPTRGPNHSFDEWIKKLENPF